MKYLTEEINLFARQSEELGMQGTHINVDPGAGGKYLTYGDKTLIDLTRLDYLALGAEKEVRQLMHTNIEAYDISCPASQMVLKTGAVNSLALSLARWHGLEDSLLFSNGYSVNMDMMQALGMRLRSPHLGAYVKSGGLGKETRHIPTVFLFDSDSHYSLIHGIRIACKFSPTCHSYSYQTGNHCQLSETLEKIRQRFGDETVKIIVSDTLASATGRYIDIAKLYAIAEQYDCLLYLDEAHAVATVGPQGAGVARQQLPDGFEPERIIIMGTLTKGFSQLGGYAAFGCKKLMSMIYICAPQYIFSAPLLPWMAATLEQILTLIAGPWGDERRKTLCDNSNDLRCKLTALGLDTLGSQSHIIPILIGDEVKCVRIRHSLLEEGFNIATFNYPAMPKGKAILRISMSVDITHEDIARLVASINKLCNSKAMAYA